MAGDWPVVSAIGDMQIASSGLLSLVHEEKGARVIRDRN